MSRTVIISQFEEPKTTEIYIVVNFANGDKVLYISKDFISFSRHIEKYYDIANINNIEILHNDIQKDNCIGYQHEVVHLK